MKRNLKDFLFKKFFFIYKAEKSSVCEKKSKIAHNFFVTKATDLKTIFLKTLQKCM